MRSLRQVFSMKEGSRRLGFRSAVHGDDDFASGGVKPRLSAGVWPNFLRNGTTRRTNLLLNIPKIAGLRSVLPSSDETTHRAPQGAHHLCQRDISVAVLPFFLKIGYDESKTDSSGSSSSCSDPWRGLLFVRNPDNCHAQAATFLPESMQQILVVPKLMQPTRTNSYERAREALDFCFPLVITGSCPLQLDAGARYPGDTSMLIAPGGKFPGSREGARIKNLSGSRPWKYGGKQSHLRPASS